MPFGNLLNPGCGCCGSGPPPRNLFFLVRVCGLNGTLLKVTVTGVPPLSYTQTRIGPSPVAFPGLPMGEYDYAITTCSGAVITGRTTPGLSSFTYDNSPPPGRHCGCCGDSYFFPDTVTVSDATGECTLAYIGVVAGDCGQSHVTYVGEKVVGGFSGVCWTPGGGFQRGVCTPATVSLTIRYSVRCEVAEDGLVTFLGSRTWAVNQAPSPCPVGPVSYTAGICCFTTHATDANGDFHSPVTHGGSLERESDQGAQECGPIDFTLGVTDTPFTFEGTYSVAGCHPALGDTLTVTE